MTYFFPQKIQIECPHFALRGGTEPCKLRHPRLARPKPNGNPRGWRASRGSKTFPLLDAAPFSKGGMKDRIFPTLASPFLLNPFWNGPKKGFWLRGHMELPSATPPTRAHGQDNTDNTGGAFYSQGTLLDKGSTCPSLPLAHFCLPMSPPGARARAGAAAPLLELPPRSPSSCSEPDPLGIKSPEQGHTEQARTHRHAG